MALSIRAIHPVFAAECRAWTSAALVGRNARRSRTAWTATPCWCSAAALTDGRSVRSRALRRARGVGPVVRSPHGRGRLRLDMPEASNLDKDQGRWRATTGGACSILATGCGIPTARISTSRRVFAAVRAFVVAGRRPEFADMRAAYDALMPQRRRRWKTSSASTRRFSRAALSASQISRGGAAIFAGAPASRADASGHRADRCSCRRMPADHRLAGARGSDVPARSDRARHSARFVYSHTWRVDLVIWDNRQTMHRGRRFDETQVRDMRRTTVGGDAMTVAQAP